jgi:endonuclease/exonuclease/phosphatase family metal-dependent hydrolase
MLSLGYGLVLERKKLWVFNAHLDPMNRENQREQIRQIAVFMRECIQVYLLVVMGNVLEC